MFLLLKLLLIIFFNKTYAHITQDSEIIMLPAWNPTSAKDIPLTLKAFGKLIHLNLRKTDQTTSPAFEVWKHNTKYIIKKFSQLKASDPCFYFHEDHVSSAAIDFCQKNGLEGLIFVENNTLEIRPLSNDFESLPSIDDFCVRENINFSFGKPHLVKLSVQYFSNLNLYWNNFEPKRRQVRNPQQYEMQKITIKLAVFFDEAAYRMFMPLLDNDKEKIRCMILAYVNRIQAVFRLSSLGVPLDISLVRLDIMEKQALHLPVVDSNIFPYEQVLRSFCGYASTLNSPQSNPGHWDIGFYLTGIDLYMYLNESRKWSAFILGGANRDHICFEYTSCGMVEFHAFEITSSGLKSSLLAAHEIGHILGLEHDNDSNSKETYDYIMSPIYEKNIMKVKWSETSKNRLRSNWSSFTHMKGYSCLQHQNRLENDVYAIDNWFYLNLPGKEWTAKAQCEVFLRDKDANVVTLHDICQSLQCETPHKKTYYFTGPALDGTHCALGKECRKGECIPVIEPPYILEYCEDDDWSEWKEDSCKSGCLESSKGVKTRRRFCKHGGNRTANCNGPYYDVVLCDDSLLCSGERKTDSDFIIKKCTEFSRVMSELGTNEIFKIGHEIGKPWIACTVHCARKNSEELYVPYAPRQEMLDHGIDPYFPDGMWCHKESGENYYCLQHYCLPESYSFEE